MVVLFVIMLTSLLVISLLGLSLTTAKFSGDQSIRERRARAADAAMESVLNEVTRDPTGNLAFPKRVGVDGVVAAASNCTDAINDASSLPRSSTVPGGTMVVGGVEVTVSCETVQPDTAGAAEGVPSSGLTSSMVGVVQSSNSDTVRVIGTSNGGDQQGWSTAWPWSTFWADNPKTEGTDESFGSSVQAGLAAANPTVLHRGPQPLTVAGNLEVSQEAVGLLEQQPESLGGFDSAVAVTGQFRQGRPGLLSTIASRDTADAAYDASDPSATCGVLQPLSGLWKVYSASIRAGGGLSCSQDGRPGTPNLLGTTWRSSVATPSEPVLGDTPTKRSLDLRWTPATILWGSVANSQRLSAVNGKPSPFTGSAQEVPATCPSASTFTFVPGAYTKEQTARLNALWNGSCRDKTWLFPPGDYWFDADANAGYAVMINDDSARIVFGEPVSSSLTDGDFPGACDSSVQGAAITLSERTSIRHLEGRVSICGKDGRGSQAIWQGSNANLGWNPEVSLATTIGGDFDNASNALSQTDGGASATAHFLSCWSPLFQGQQCSGGRTLTLDNVAALPDQAPGSAPVDSIQVLVRGDALKSDVSGTRVGVTLTTAAPSAVSCTVWYSGLPDGNQLLAYELLDPVRGNCAGRITDREQLVNASVALTFDIRAQCSLWGLVCFEGGPALSVDYVGLRVPWTASTTGASSVGYSQPNGALRPWDNVVAARQTNCSAFSCSGPAPASVTMTGISDAASPDLSSAASAETQLTSAYVLVSGRAWNVDPGASLLDVTVLDTNNSTWCFAQFRGVPGPGALNHQPAAYDLLDPTIPTNNCKTRLTSASQLLGKQVRVTTSIVKAGNCIGSWIPMSFEGLFTWTTCTSWGSQIDAIGVSTTSGVPRAGGGIDSSLSYDGPSQPFLVTSDNDRSAGTDAVFDVNGQTSLPRADLNVHWNGDAPIGVSDLPVPGSLVAKPLFSGGGQYALVAGSITSSTGPDGSVGTLCCVPSKPAQRQVKLTVHLGGVHGRVIGAADVLISDVVVNGSNAGRWSAGQRTSVQSWNLCGAGVSDVSRCRPF